MISPAFAMAIGSMALTLAEQGKLPPLKTIERPEPKVKSASLQRMLRKGRGR